MHGKAPFDEDSPRPVAPFARMTVARLSNGFAAPARLPPAHAGAYRQHRLVADFVAVETLTIKKPDGEPSGFSYFAMYYLPRSCRNRFVYCSGVVPDTELHVADAVLIGLGHGVSRSSDQKWMPTSPLAFT